MNEDKKLNGRDLINIGIYGAIYFVILFAVAMLGMIPIFLPLLSVFVPILGGIPFMLFLTRVKKPGMIFIFAMIMGILMLLTGMGPWPLVTCAVAGLLAELVFKSGNYRDAKKAVLSYGLFKGRKYNNRDRQKLCYLVMQDTGNQLFTESVLEEVLISLPKNTENAEDRAAELLGQLDLVEYLDRHPQSLSGGQKQRLAIVCALASGREILLLDEPTSGLDHGHMIETADMLKKLRDMGTTILVVTHDTELIRHCCSRMISESSFLSHLPS